MIVKIELNEPETKEIKDYVDQIDQSQDLESRATVAYHMIMHRILNSDAVYEAVKKIAGTFK